MILRKPYAFFIKHFRFIHLILAVLMFACVYYSKRLLDFFNEYILENLNLKGQELVSTYFPTIYQLLPFFIIIVLIIILVVMFIKKKPNLIYIINVIICVYNIVIIQICKSTVSNMEEALLDTRATRLVRDFLMISFILQIVMSVIIAIRAIGFDIKKFDFKQDLKSLEINESDREEFLLEFNFDENKTKRQIRKTIRYLKYAYKENKIIILLSTLFVFIIGLFLGFKFANKEKSLDENTYISNNGITLKVTNSYITNTDYSGKIIDEENTFVILQIDIKKNISSNLSLDMATVKLIVKNYSYTPTYEYKDSFFDFGNVYIGEELNNEYEKKVLVYKIPKQFEDEDMQFHFVNKNTQEKHKISLSIKNLTDNYMENSYNLGDEVSFENSIFNDYKMIISNFDVQKKYKLSYNFCYSNICKESYQYLVPSINTNQDKSILKITGTLNGEVSIPNIYSLCDFISNFGTINYTVDGINKVNTIPLKQIIAKKKDYNTFYIEVTDEILNASSISINLNIRNKSYKYILK